MYYLFCFTYKKNTSCPALLKPYTETRVRPNELEPQAHNQLNLIRLSQTRPGLGQIKALNCNLYCVTRRTHSIQTKR